MPKATCSVPGCDRPVKVDSRQLCGAHAQRRLRDGDVRADVPLRGTSAPNGDLWCSRCETFKAPDDFFRNRSTKTGRDGVCKECTNRRRAERKVQRALVSKAWREKHRDRLAAEKRAAYHCNPQASTEAGRRWRKEHPDKVKAQIRAQNLARYARLKAAPGHATPEQVQARWDYYSCLCWMCGQPATDTDHVKPLAKGGSNWPANLRPACRHCNRSKSDTWPYKPLTKEVA